MAKNDKARKRGKKEKDRKKGKNKKERERTRRNALLWTIFTRIRG